MVVAARECPNLRSSGRVRSAVRQRERPWKLHASKRRCDLGLGDSCRALVSILGTAASTSKPEYLGMMEKACGLGVSSLCTRVGEHYEESGGSRGDTGRAMEWHRRAFEIDARACGACLTLSEHYEKGRGVGQNAQEARRLVHLAASIYIDNCDAGDAYACGAFARMADLVSGAYLKIRSARQRSMKRRAEEASTLNVPRWHACITKAEVFRRMPPRQWRFTGRAATRANRTPASRAAISNAALPCTKSNVGTVTGCLVRYCPSVMALVPAWLQIRLALMS